jgi:uroporphyrin-3 C-methyltransferase
MSGHANQLSEFMSKKNPSSKKETTGVPAPADQAQAESDATSGEDNVQFSNEVIAKKAGEITKQKQETTTVQAPETKAIDKQEATTVLKPEAKIEEKQAAKEEVKKPEAKKPAAKPDPTPKAEKPAAAARGFPVLGLLNLVLIVAIAAAAAWYWQTQQKLEQGKQQALVTLQQQLEQQFKQQLGTKADKSTADQLRQRLKPLESVIGDSANQISELQTQQQALLESTEKLYELYGRDENTWQLAEVEYLMRVAQHKLILENDFEGAALTLQAASDKIAVTADPGLLPVRVQISDEIAGLKTRSRPDLVGMTLVLGQLGKQVRALRPGYEPRIDISTGDVEAPTVDPTTLSIEERLMNFFTSLVKVSKSESLSVPIESLTIDVRELLENNLKLTRWAVLERDAFQYRRLMDENVDVFKQYYDLDNAENYDFYSQLLELQKSQIKPEKPNISGSLEMLRHIISRRQLAPGGDLEQEAGDV